MAYIWTTELATGNSLIDAQHKQLFNSVNELMDACIRGKGRAALSATLDFLIDYTGKHFSDEEKIQQQYRFPEYASHKRLHDTFKVSIDELSQQLRTEGASVALVAKLNSSLGDWLVNHLKVEDKKIGDHIRKCHTLFQKKPEAPAQMNSTSRPFTHRINT